MSGNALSSFPTPQQRRTAHEQDLSSHTHGLLHARGPRRREPRRPRGPRGPARQTFRVNALVSDEGSQTESTDPNLKNAWGIAATATSPWWVSDNLTNLSSLYNGAGEAQQLLVTIPGSPTGIVANPTTAFPVTDRTNTGSSVFIFATLEGRIAGWNPGVPPTNPSTMAFVIIDQSDAGAVYTGVAAATTGNGPRLYAADFANARIDVFDGDLNPVVVPGAFVDPKLPSGYSPFNVQALNGRIFVAYAKVDPGTGEETKGQGLGVVDVFDTQGQFIRPRRCARTAQRPVGDGDRAAGVREVRGESPRRELRRRADPGVQDE
jgi:uncharacterized protein (TIGR03118 family)